MSATAALDAEIQSQLLASAAPPRRNRTWIIVAAVLLTIVAIGVAIYVLGRRRPAAPTRRWIRTDGVDSACGTPCDVATYRDVPSYDECLARTGTVWQQVNFFTYNPTTRLCSLKSIPEPFQYKADAALQGATYRFPPTQS
jgi:hypothetical protein